MIATVIVKGAHNMKILLVDDHALFRDGMHYVLRQLDEQIEILDAGNFSAALAQAEQHPDLDLVLLDLNLPGAEGIPSVKLFHTRFPALPLVVISASDHRDDIEKVLNNGAMGFISKMSNADAMVQALRLVLDGGVYLPPQLLQRAVSGAEQHPRVDRRSWRTNEFGLTARQMDVLHLLAEGQSNKVIADAMGLAEGTVKIHVAAIFSALRVNRRADAVNTARRLGMLTELADHNAS